MPGKGSKSKWQQKRQSQRDEPAVVSPTRSNGCKPGDVIPIKPKLQKRFYEALVLLNVLSKSRGEHIDEEPLEQVGDPSELVDEHELRRAFWKQLAYICD